MKNNLLAVALVAGLPTMTLAQGIEHLGSEFGLGYFSVTSGSSGSSDEGAVISMKSDWALGANFGLQVNGSARDFDFGTTQTYGLHGWYQIAPAIRLGAFAQQSTITVTGGPLNVSGRLFGLEALVEPGENAAIQIYAGKGTTDLGIIDPSAELTSYGMSASYDFTPALTGRISFDNGKQTISGNSASSQIMGFGIDWHTKGFGDAPMTIAVDYAKYNAFFDDGTRISITAKISLGGASGTPRRLFENRYAPVYTLVF